eukprot:EG_transcript_11990
MCHGVACKIQSKRTTSATPATRATRTTAPHTRDSHAAMEPGLYGKAWWGVGGRAFGRFPYCPGWSGASWQPGCISIVISTAWLLSPNAIGCSVWFGTGENSKRLAMDLTRPQQMIDDISSILDSWMIQETSKRNP